MAQDTLVVLCKTLNDALIASSQIERRHDLNRLFVFLGKRPLEKDLSWMGQSDSSFCLERAIEWSTNPEIIGVRAGLMFASGWDLLFCWGDNCPFNKDIDWIRGKLKSDGMARLSNVWGITRDYYILQGLGEDVQILPFEKRQAQNNIVAGIQLAEALEGKSVSEHVAVAALQEVVMLSPLAVHETALRSSHDKLVSLIVNSAEYIDEDAPVSLLIGEDCDDSTLNLLKTKIANHGSIVQVCRGSQMDENKPYRTIHVDGGAKIVLYGK